MRLKSLRNKSFKDILKAIDNYIGFARIGMIWYSNWFNPLATFWLNFRSFPLSQAWRLPVAVYGHPRLFNLSGKMKVEGKISFGMIAFNKTRPTSPSNMGVQSEILNQGLIIFHGRGVIGTGNKIRVAAKAVLDIGARFKITDFVNIGCYTRIDIGEQSWVVHRCQLLDANYHYIANFKKGIIPKWAKPISIGKGCWICNSTTVTGGAVIPDFTIVASNSLVNKDFSNIEQSSMIGGCPAKYLATGFRRVENPNCEHAISQFYFDNSDVIFHIPESMTPEKVSNYI